MSDEPPEKRPCLLDKNKCIICFQSLGSSKGKAQVVKNPTTDGVKTILRIAQARNDEIYAALSPYEDDLISGKLNIFFHKSCRASYTSSSNNYMFKQDEQVPSVLQSGEYVSRTCSRAESSLFNIRKQCFICGSDSERKEILTQIQTGTGQSTREKVLHTAEERQDEVVHSRMLNHPDLFAFDAKYHRNCYSIYITKHSVEAAKRKISACPIDESSYDKAFKCITEYINSFIISKKTDVSNLSSLRNEYIRALGTEDSSYSSWILKKRLVHHFGEKLVFIERRGKSDLVCSSKMTVGDALAKASLLDEPTDIEYEDLTSNIASSCIDESQILHLAAGILQQKMSDIHDEESYISALDLDPRLCGDFVPDILYNFINWLVDDKANQEVISCTDDGKSKDNLKIISLCHAIIGLSQRVRTPIALGLGIHVHHNFGRRHLVEILNNLGYSVSYDEIRKFLTSVAVAQRTDVTFVPKGLLESDNSVLVDAAIDNFDQNETTLDGKQTTHSMAAVLYKRCPINASDCHIPRAHDRSLLPQVQDEDITRYVIEIQVGIE